MIPLDPDRDQARRWAQEELAKREYANARPGPIERAIDWLMERIKDLLDAVSGSSNPWSAVGIGVVLTLIAAVVAYAIWRAGGPGRLRRARSGTDEVFDGDRTLTAAEHRSAAVAAFAEQDWERAVLERFRAIYRELEERTVLAPRPGRTAGEVSREAATAVGDAATELHRAAQTFDGVRYGGRAATREAAEQLAVADDAVRAARLVTR